MVLASCSVRSMRRPMDFDVTFPLSLIAAGITFAVFGTMFVLAEQAGSILVCVVTGIFAFPAGLYIIVILLFWFFFS